MATTKDFIDYFLEIVNSIPDIAVRPMMGEYVLYYRGKVIGGIYDNRVLIKNLQCAKEFLPDAQLQLPYEGAKMMLYLEDFEDVQNDYNLFKALYAELPEPKIKKRKA